MQDHDSTPSELWLPVAEHPSLYAVSSLGRVKSFHSHIHGHSGYILTPRPTPKGYYLVTLAFKGREFKRYVHRLVAVAFIGPIPEGNEVNHCDGDKSNNSVGNLEYVTHKRNIHHAIETGLMWFMPPHEHISRHGAKLTAQQVAEIRSLDGKMFRKDIAALYGVSGSAVSMLLNGRTWIGV